MRVVFDNNVILDWLLSRKPFAADAEKLFEHAANGKIQGFVGANSLTDVYYLLCRKIDKAKSKNLIDLVMNLLDTIDLTATDCRAALALPMDDFEDALVVVCAEKAGADFIVTRDDALLQAELAVKCILPGDLLQTFQKARCEP